MKIHAYQLSQVDGYDFVAVLNQLADRPLDSRFLDDSLSAMRLEALTVEDGLILADFMRRREHGPGLYRRGEPLGGFNIDVSAGDGFGEETAMVYDPASGFLVVQYNHFGPRPLGIADYIDGADESWVHPNRNQTPVFEFGVRLRPDGYARLRGMSIFRSFEAKISVPAVSKNDLSDGRGLGSVLQNPIGGLETVTIKYSTGLPRDSSLHQNDVLRLLNQIQRLGDAVRRVVVKAKPTEDDSTETINLLDDRLEVDLPIEIGDDGRYPRNIRWALLKSAYRTWRRDGSL